MSKKIEVVKLKNPYVTVEGSFGGNQGWFKDMENKFKGKTINGFGCGLIGASDVLLHILGTTENVLDKNLNSGIKIGKMESKTGGDLNHRLSQSVARVDYDKYIQYMEKHFFRILPKLGISGVLMAWNLNMYFLLNRKKIKKITGGRYWARWAVLPQNILSRIKEMLSNDIPVVLAIGPGMFRKNKLTFYNKLNGTDGSIIFKPITKTKDHYVTVTGVEEYIVTSNGSNGNKQDRIDDSNSKTMLEISSWGKKYYVNYSDYIDYVKKNDNYYFSNILYIKKR